MGRYSFPSEDLDSVEVSATQWRECDDSSSDDNDESSIDSSDEEEYPHPLGFPSYGKTLFFLDPPIESAQKARRRLGFLKEKDDFLERTDHDFEGTVQSFPPLSTYVDPKTASTKALLSYSKYNDRRDEEEDPLDGVAQLLEAARIVEDDAPQHAKLLVETQQAGQQLLAMSKSAEREIQSTRQDMMLRRQELERQHQETHAAFLLILKRDQEAADKILKQQEEEARAREEADQLRKDKEAKDKAERQRIADERQKQEQAKQQKAIEAARKRQEEEEAATEEEAKKTEYIVKAKKRVAQLVELRASVAPFETSKNVSRRRLKMKKIIKGKVNTLSQDAQKIQSVAHEVTQAILQAKEEDDQLKEQIRAGNKEITEEMIRGKRYLVDLLASDTMVRAQAEGFNGTRGDGFPLANMLAMVSTQVKELVPILSAHIYTVCPTAIPTLPKVTKNESEQELMESLGMARGSGGEFETFDRFLARTEGIISLVADIMASNPPDHSLLGGHQGAIEWLERFLSHLPLPPETMPLLTAPVLDAFLTGAGHMLANKYPDDFKKYLDVITNDTVRRLDEGPIGAPSALRLKKTIQGGFESFKTDFPPKAIPSLYNSGASSASAMSGFGQGTTTTSSIPTTVSNPFRGSRQQTSSGPFTSGGNGPSTMPNPFGASSGTAGSTSFGDSSTTTSAPSPFGAMAPSPFGQFSSTRAQTTGSFGGTFAQQKPTGFGGGITSSSSSPFGQQTSNINPSPFGQQSSGANPFGGQNQTTNVQSAFGGGFNTPSFGQPSGASQSPSTVQISSASPFGLPNSSSSAGGQTQTMGMSLNSSFGAVSNPFGAPSSQSNTGNTFGAPATLFGGSQTTPFGGGGRSAPFGSGSQSAPFGSGIQNPPVGSGIQNTPFGSGSQSAPFGSGSQNTPFGSGGQSTPSGNGSQISPFGGGQLQSGPTAFGGGNGGGSKPPCKFFAQGKCRYGTNCRFSHDTPGIGFNSSNNPFGGPRR